MKNKKNNRKSGKVKISDKTVEIKHSVFGTQYCFL